MTETIDTDVAIIGAGPVGLFAVFECGMLKMRCQVIDSLEVIGGQLAALYPEKPIYDIPGYPTLLARELIAKLEEQAQPFKPGYHLDQRVERLTPTGDGGFRLETSKGAAITAKAVLIAAGVGAFGPNRPPLDGIEAFEGRSVFYLVKDPETLRDKRVVIAGGGDSAVDWALVLAGVAAQVTIVHRRAKFRAAPESVRRLEALTADGKVELAVPYQLAGLSGDEGRLAAVALKDLDGARKEIPADVLLPFYGLSMNLGPIAEWGLNLEENHIAVDPATAETSVPGVYAIGDISTYKNKLKLILCGFSEAAMAAHAIYGRVFPDQELHWEYSTTKGLPDQA